MKKGNLPLPLDSLAQCPQCHVTKPRRDWYANPTSRSGYQHICKDCMKANQKARYRDMIDARDAYRLMRDTKEAPDEA
jgi:hypothetical protein